MVPPTPPTYERSPIPAASLEDLDQDALEAFMRRRVPTLYDEVDPSQLAASVGVLAMGEVTSTPVIFATSPHDFLVTLPSPLGPQSGAGAGN